MGLQPGQFSNADPASQTAANKASMQASASSMFDITGKLTNMVNEGAKIAADVVAPGSGELLDAAGAFGDGNASGVSSAAAAPATTDVAMDAATGAAKGATSPMASAAVSENAASGAVANAGSKLIGGLI